MFTYYSEMIRILERDMSPESDFFKLQDSITQPAMIAAGMTMKIYVGRGHVRASLR